MCFVKPKETGGLKGPNGEDLLLDLNNIGKESPIEILRKIPKTREQINSIIEEKIAKLPKDKGDNL